MTWRILPDSPAGFVTTSLSVFRLCSAVLNLDLSPKLLTRLTRGWMGLLRRVSRATGARPHSLRINMVVALRLHELICKKYKHLFLFTLQNNTLQTYLTGNFSFMSHYNSRADTFVDFFFLHDSSMYPSLLNYSFYKWC